MRLWRRTALTRDFTIASRSFHLVLGRWHKLPCQLKLAASEGAIVVQAQKVISIGGLSGNSQVYLGERADGIERLSRAVELQPDDFVTLYNVACGFSVAGENDRALDLLERA